MLSRSQRLSTAQFNYVMEKGRAFHSTLFLLRTCAVPNTNLKTSVVIPMPDLSKGGKLEIRPQDKLIGISKDRLTRIAAAVPNKVGKRAVDRTRMRRKIYGAVQSFKPNIKSGQLVIVFAKTTSLTATTDLLNREMKEIFVKAGLMR